MYICSYKNFEKYEKCIQAYHFYLMFGLFSIPRASYSYCGPSVYRQRYVPLESYLIRSIRQAQEAEYIKSLLYETLVQQKKDTKNNENISNNIDKKESPSQDKQKRIQKAKYSPLYYFESHSRFDGDKIIEEEKTQKIDSEGKVHKTLKRKIGDQWYETEEIKEKEEGKVVVKESWHNVSEDEVEKFKEEWISKSGSMLKLKQNEGLKTEENQEQELKERTIKNDELEEGQSENNECENENKNNKI